MKSTSTPAPKKDNVITLPALLLDEKDGMVLLATSEDEMEYSGVIVVSDRTYGPLQVGSYSRGLGKAHFNKLYEGTIHLSNEE